MLLVHIVGTYMYIGRLTMGNTVNFTYLISFKGPQSRILASYEYPDQASKFVASAQVLTVDIKG